VLLSQRLLLAMPKISGECTSARQGSSIQGMLVSDINILQGSVATHLSCGGIFNKRFIASFLLRVLAKEL